MSFSSRSIFTGTPRRVVGQIFEHSMAQSSWHVKLASEVACAACRPGSKNFCLKCFFLSLVVAIWDAGANLVFLTLSWLKQKSGSCIVFLKLTDKLSASEFAILLSDQQWMRIPLFLPHQPSVLPYFWIFVNLIGKNNVSVEFPFAFLVKSDTDNPDICFAFVFLFLQTVSSCHLFIFLFWVC